LFMGTVDWGLMREGDWLSRIGGELTIESGPWCEAVVLNVPVSEKPSFELFTAAGYAFEPDGDQGFGAVNHLVWRPLSSDVPAAIKYQMRQGLCGMVLTWEQLLAQANAPLFPAGDTATRATKTPHGSANGGARSYEPRQEGEGPEAMPMLSAYHGDGQKRKFRFVNLDRNKAAAPGMATVSGIINAGAHHIAMAMRDLVAWEAVQLIHHESQYPWLNMYAPYMEFADKEQAKAILSGTMPGLIHIMLIGVWSEHPELAVRLELQPLANDRTEVVVKCIDDRAVECFQVLIAEMRKRWPEWPEQCPEGELIGRPPLEVTSNAEQGVPDWVPKKPEKKEVMRKQWRLMLELDREYQERYDNGDTEDPKPKDDDYITYLKSEGHRANTKTPYRVRTAFKNGWI